MVIRRCGINVTWFCSTGQTEDVQSRTLFFPALHPQPVRLILDTPASFLSRPADIKMKKFNDLFQKKLLDAVEKIESRSHAEIIVAIAPRSAPYQYVNLWAGAILTFAVFSFLMFAPIDFGTLYIYAGTLYAFAAGYLAMSGIPALKRAIIGQKKLTDQVELKARAFFQKAGINETGDRIGILIYFSFYEKQVLILPDRGAKKSIPPEELEKLHSEFLKVFSARHSSIAIIESLEESAGFFGKFIPRTNDDMNELPDTLRIMP